MHLTIFVKTQNLVIKICLVEDEKSISELIQLNLELEGYDVNIFDHGKKSKDALIDPSIYNLIILDVMLPGVSGINLCKHIRAVSNVPVLFLSAKGTTSDRIEGLKAGGNDYLPKPFDLEELLLRVGILTQIDVSVEEETLKVGRHIVNFKTYTVKNQETHEEIQLSKKEIGIIRLFLSKKGEVVSRNEILDEVWGADQYPTTRTIDNFILNLRKILEEDPRSPKYIHSVRGVGYKFTL